MNFEAVIGLETHVQLNTESKIFCGCPAKPRTGVSVADQEINSSICPVCTAQPGTLPVLNQKVVEFALRAGLATQCSIRSPNVFARKNYFYPDLPKGYQITQFELPIAENGFILIDLPSGEKKIRLKRIHIEEDAGKNVHYGPYSLVNLNRAGVPLIEVVTEPDLSTPQEASQYMKALYALVTYLEICDGNLQEGNFRCDANVSVRPIGESRLGTRVEIKNVNSFRYIEKAIEYEIHRQVEMIRAGKRIVQETRGFDSARGVTQTLRVKEEAEEYRYFPDPDLAPIVISDRQIELVRVALPELPRDHQKRLESEYKLSSYDASVLTTDKTLAVFFDQCIAYMRPKAKPEADVPSLAKSCCNLLTTEVLRFLTENQIEMSEVKITPSDLGELTLKWVAQEVSSTGAKKVLEKLLSEGGSVELWVTKLGVKQENNDGELMKIVESVLAENGAQFKEYCSGKDKVIGFLVGQIMKKTGGKANPSKVQMLIADIAKKSG